MASIFKMQFLKNLACKAFVQRSLSSNVGFVRHFSASKREDNKPAAPLNSYFAYLISIRKNIDMKNPDKSVAEKCKIAGAMYRSLSETEKKELQAAAAARYAQYKKEKEEWLKTLTEEEILNMKEEAKEKREKHRKRQLHKLARENNKPERPLRRYHLFNKVSQKKKELENLDFIEKQKAIMKQWQGMPDSEKKAYENQALVDCYKADLLAWEKEMITKGLLKLVRKATLKKELPKPPRKIVARKKVAKKTVAKKAAVKSVKRKTAVKKSSKSTESKSRADTKSYEKGSDEVSSDSDSN